MSHLDKKETIEKINFYSNTVLSLYLKVRAKNITPQNNSCFAPLLV